MARDTLQGLLDAFTEDAEVPDGGDLSLTAGPLDIGFGIDDAGAPTAADSTAKGVEAGVSENREEHFSRESGRFHDPTSGEFEPGSPPPDLDTSVDRYRAGSGKFKDAPDDLYDEPAEVAEDSLEPQG